MEGGVQVGYIIGRRAEQACQHHKEEENNDLPSIGSLGARPRSQFRGSGQFTSGILTWRRVISSYINAYLCNAFYHSLSLTYRGWCVVGCG